LIVFPRFRAHRVPSSGQLLTSCHRDNLPAFEAIRKAIEYATAVQDKQYDIIDGYSFYIEADDTDAAKNVELSYCLS